MRGRVLYIFEESETSAATLSLWFHQLLWGIISSTLFPLHFPLLDTLSCLSSLEGWCLLNFDLFLFFLHFESHLSVPCLWCIHFLTCKVPAVLLIQIAGSGCISVTNQCFHILDISAYPLGLFVSTSSKRTDCYSGVITLSLTRL